MGYVAWSVVFGEQPSAAKWNILGTNDSSFNDGTGIGNNTILSTHLKLTGSLTANVLTDQPTTNTTYVDLGTVGPAVTATIGSSGIALVIVSCDTNNNSTLHNYMSFAVSGNNTIAATDTNALHYVSWVANAPHQGSYAVLLTGLATGSTTFTAKYRTTGSTGNFKNRYISVIPV